MRAVAVLEEWPEVRRVRCTSVGLSHGACSSVQAGRCIRGATGVLISTRLSERIALRGDHAQQLIPRGDEGRGALILQPHRKRVEIHAGPRELLQHYLRI